MTPIGLFKGETALVTGSSRGLGRAMAEGLANAGAKIIVNGTDAARVAKALRNGLGQMPSYKDKLTDAEIEALSLYVSKASGGAK